MSLTFIPILSEVNYLAFQVVPARYATMMAAAAVAVPAAQAHASMGSAALMSTCWAR
jgi:hypothetical protein